MWIFFLWGVGGGSFRYRTIVFFFVFFVVFFFLGGGGSFLYIIGRFKVKIQNGSIFWGRKFPNIFGLPDIPDIPDLFFCCCFFLWGGFGG